MSDTEEKSDNIGIDFLCEKCKNRGLKCNIGSCEKCKRDTSSGSLNYCQACGKEMGVCQFCGEEL